MSELLTISDLRIGSPEGGLACDLRLRLEGPPGDAIRYRARLIQQVIFLLTAGPPLRTSADLEDATWLLLRWLLLPPEDDAPRPAALQATVRLHAPVGRAARTGLARDQEYEVELKPWGTVDIVAEDPRRGFYRLTLGPGGLLPEHYHRRMTEVELVVTPGLHGWRDDQTARPLPVGTLRRWRPHQRHGYHNPGARSASLLCMDAPPFDPTDEIITRAAPPQTEQP